MFSVTHTLELTYASLCCKQLRALRLPVWACHGLGARTRGQVLHVTGHYEHHHHPYQGHSSGP